MSSTMMCMSVSEDEINGVAFKDLTVEVLKEMGFTTGPHKIS